jgi:hypothetical protein
MSDDENAGSGNQGGNGGSNDSSSQVPNPLSILDLQTESYKPTQDSESKILNEQTKRR